VNVTGFSHLVFTLRTSRLFSNHPSTNRLNCGDTRQLSSLFSSRHSHPFVSLGLAPTQHQDSTVLLPKVSHTAHLPPQLLVCAPWETSKHTFSSSFVSPRHRLTLHSRSRLRSTASHIAPYRNKPYRNAQSLPSIVMAPKRHVVGSPTSPASAEPLLPAALSAAPSITMRVPPPGVVGVSDPAPPARPAIMLDSALLRPPDDSLPILADRFRTKVCRNFVAKGTCPYTDRCMFAHGDAQLRTPEMNFRDNLLTGAAIRDYQIRVDGASVSAMSSGEVQQHTLIATPTLAAPVLVQPRTPVLNPPSHPPNPPITSTEPFMRSDRGPKPKRAMSAGTAASSSQPRGRGAHTEPTSPQGSSSPPVLLHHAPAIPSAGAGGAVTGTPTSQQSASPREPDDATSTAERGGSHPRRGSYIHQPYSQRPLN
jgi:hypothetical protein